MTTHAPHLARCLAFLLLALLLGVAFPAMSSEPGPAPDWSLREGDAFAHWFELDRHQIAGPRRLRVRASDARQSQVMIDVIVDETGAVAAAEVQPVYNDRPVPRRVQAQALAAARQWRFRPIVRRGRPVRARGTVGLQLIPPARTPRRQDAMPQVPAEEVEITLERSGCFGSCAAYSATVRGDGRVVFEGSSYVLAPGRHEYAVPRERAEALVARFAAAGFWSLHDAYEANVTDSPGYRLTVRAGGQTKSVYDYVGHEAGMPDVVEALEDAVDETADTARWIAGNERTVDSLAAEGFDFTSPAAAAMFGMAAASAPEVALALLERGAPVDLALPCGDRCAGATHRSRAVQEALREGHLTLFERLNEDRAFAGLSGEAMSRLLSLAANTRSPRLVAALLARGADPRIAPGDGDAPLIAAVGDRYSDFAADADEPAVFRLLLARSAPLEARSGLGWTALQNAYAAHPETVRLLLAAGANVDAGARDRDGRPGQPLLYLTEDERIALMLLAAGADRGLRDMEGRTLSERARALRWTRVEALLGAGAAAR